MPGVREKHHFSHHFLVQALFGLWIWFEIRPRGIEIQGRQLVLDPQGELKQLYYHKALRGAAVWGFWFGEQQNDWHFGERRPLELQKESRMRASNSSSTLLGENENGWNIQRNDSILREFWQQRVFVFSIDLMIYFFLWWYSIVFFHAEDSLIAQRVCFTKQRTCVIRLSRMRSFSCNPDRSLLGVGTLGGRKLGKNFPLGSFSDTWGVRKQVESTADLEGFFLLISLWFFFRAKPASDLAFQRKSLLNSLNMHLERPKARHGLPEA